MIDIHLIKSALDKIDGAFDLYGKGRASPFILAVNVRSQADGLRAFHDDVATALSGMADQIEEASKDPKKGKDVIRDLEGRYRVWKRETVAVLEGIAKTESKVAKDDGKAAREALLREAKGVTAAPPQDASAKKAAQAEIEALGAGPADEPVEMSMEDIQKILNDTKRKL